MTQWINFRELRERLSLARAMEHCNVEVIERRQGRHQGFCPLPAHQGQGRSPSFSADLTRGIWQCFGCKRRICITFSRPLYKGPRHLAVLRLQTPGRRARLRDLDGGARPREQRRRADGRRQTPSALRRGEHNPRRPERTPQRKAEPAPPASSQPPAVVNPPLDFLPKDVDPEDPYLRERGFTEETIRHFDLGYATRGLMKGRVAIPLYNDGGALIGYAGRLTRDDQVNEQNPATSSRTPRSGRGS